MTLIHGGDSIFCLTLNRVRDKIRVREGKESIILRVDGDPLKIVAGLNTVQALLKAIDDNSKPGQVQGAAHAFATAIFGQAQAKALEDFYMGDPTCVINVCSKYFSERLARKIEKVQVRAGRK